MKANELLKSWPPEEIEELACKTHFEEIDQPNWVCGLHGELCENCMTLGIGSDIKDALQNYDKERVLLDIPVAKLNFLLDHLLKLAWKERERDHDSYLSCEELQD